MSKNRQISLDEIDWEKKIDENVDWAPNRLAPLTYLPSFAKLSLKAQRRYNHYFALGINEYFSLFEEYFLIRCLLRLKKIKSVELKEAIEHFIDDERRHSEMFHALNRRAAPQFYSSTKKYHFLTNTWLFSAALKFAASWPRLFVVWIWVAVFMEERTLFFSQVYSQESHSLEPRFVHAHRLHMIEELRHVCMDSYLIDEVYKTAPKILRRWSAWMFAKLIIRLRSPRVMTMAILGRLKKDYPDELKVFALLEQELPLLAQCSEYHDLLFSSKATRRTYALMAQHREFRPFFVGR